MVDGPCARERLGFGWRSRVVAHRLPGLTQFSRAVPGLRRSPVKPDWSQATYLVYIEPPRGYCSDNPTSLPRSAQWYLSSLGGVISLRNLHLDYIGRDAAAVTAT